MLIANGNINTPTDTNKPIFKKHRVFWFSCSVSGEKQKTLCCFGFLLENQKTPCDFLDFCYVRKPKIP